VRPNFQECCVQEEVEGGRGGTGRDDGKRKEEKVKKKEE